MFLDFVLKYVLNGDVLMAASYVSLLALTEMKRKSLPSDWQLMLSLNAFYLLGNSTVSILSVWNTWHSDYWIENSLRITVAVTGMVGIALLGRDFPRVIKIQDFERYHRDTLTGLPDERYLNEGFNKLVLAYLYIDLDRFKIVNDTHGHRTGDSVLKLAAERIKTAASPYLAVRLHGDEFAVILTSTVQNPEQEALTIAKHLVKLLEQPFIVGDLSLRISASVGIAFVSQLNEDLSTLRMNADIAMYQGKTNRDLNRRIHIYEPGMAIRISEEKAIEEELRRAIDLKEFVLFYQPIVRLIDGFPVAGFEALIRWQHPTKGLLGPDTFIKVAEQTGLISRICDWVFHEAFMQGRKWSVHRGENIKIGINLSALDLERQSFIDLVRSQLKAMPGFASVPFFEITETAFSTNESQLPFLEAVYKLGPSVAIDDFGTGYSTLSRLNSLKKLITAIKIDRSFLEDDNVALYEVIVQAAKLMGLEVVAEGIETTTHLDLLTRLKCEYGQGYYFYRPMPASEIERLGII